VNPHIELRYKYTDGSITICYNKTTGKFDAFLYGPPNKKLYGIIDSSIDDMTFNNFVYYVRINDIIGKYNSIKKQIFGNSNFRLNNCIYCMKEAFTYKYNNTIRISSKFEIFINAIRTSLTFLYFTM